MLDEQSRWLIAVEICQGKVQIIGLIFTTRAVLAVSEVCAPPRRRPPSPSEPARLRRLMRPRQQPARMTRSSTVSDVEDRQRS